MGHTLWMKGAICRAWDPEEWFSETGHYGPANAKALALCGMCNVQADCLEYAIGNRIAFGIWGGRTPQQRARLAGLKRYQSRWTGGHAK